MGYKNLKQCLDDLSQRGELKVIDIELDPVLEIPLIQRLAFKKGSPALLFSRVKNTSFPMVGNLFGTRERARFIFRDFFKRWERLSRLSIDPKSALKDPLFWRYLLRTGWDIRPKYVKKGPIEDRTCNISHLPNLISWPQDGGGYITLPQVYTEDPQRSGFGHSNLGMYRIQLSGNDYERDREVGLHYQIHRGIASHHQRAIALGRDLKVNIFVGGPSGHDPGSYYAASRGSP